MLVIIMGFAQPVYSQDQSGGRLIDSETGDPIPYANIGIPKIMSGTVSDEDGRFILKYNSVNDIVLFSAIGFET